MTYLFTYLLVWWSTVNFSSFEYDYVKFVFFLLEIFCWLLQDLHKKALTYLMIIHLTNYLWNGSFLASDWTRWASVQKSNIIGRCHRVNFCPWEQCRNHLLLWLLLLMQLFVLCSVWCGLSHRHSVTVAISWGSQDAVPRRRHWKQWRTSSQSLLTCFRFHVLKSYTGWSKKTDTQFYFWDDMVIQHQF